MDSFGDTEYFYGSFLVEIDNIQISLTKNILLKFNENMFTLEICRQLQLEHIYCRCHDMWHTIWVLVPIHCLPFCPLGFFFSTRIPIYGFVLT